MPLESQKEKKESSAGGKKKDLEKKITETYETL